MKIRNIIILLKPSPLALLVVFDRIISKVKLQYGGKYECLL